MKREDVKKILGEDASDEQVDSVLNLYHSSNKASNEKISQYEAKVSSMSDYEEFKKYKEENEKLKMTEQQRLDALKKEAEDNFRKSKLVYNNAKAKDILAGLELDDDLISTIVTDDEEKTIANATKFKEKIEAIKMDTQKKTKEELGNINQKPTAGNQDPNGNGKKLSKDDFKNMTIQEKNKLYLEDKATWEEMTK